MPKSSTKNFNEQNKGSKSSGSGKDLKPNTHLLHLSVLRQLSNRRAGTASTKTRAEVRGGGKKPWRQKGTGRARAGSIRSPLWTGGGIAFGPKPRSYKLGLSKKARNLAIAQAIKSKGDDLKVIKKLPELKEIKTKELNAWVKSQGLKTPLLIVTEASESGFKKVKLASGNLPYVSVQDQKNVGTYEVIRASNVLITENAMSGLEKRFSKK